MIVLLKFTVLPAQMFVLEAVISAVGTMAELTLMIIVSEYTTAGFAQASLEVSCKTTESPSFSVEVLKELSPVPAF